MRHYVVLQNKVTAMIAHVCTAMVVNLDRNRFFNNKHISKLLEAIYFATGTIMRVPHTFASLLRCARLNSTIRFINHIYVDTTNKYHLPLFQFHSIDQIVNTIPIHIFKIEII